MDTIAVRQAVLRTLGVIGLSGIALVHLLDLPGKFSEVPYMAWMYVALILGSVALAAVLIRDDDPRAWAAAAALAASVVTGYVLSRTVGLPQSSDDIGNWGEPLGMASLLVEGALLGLAGMMAAVRRPLSRAVRTYAPSEQSRLLQGVA